MVACIGDGSQYGTIWASLNYGGGWYKIDTGGDWRDVTMLPDGSKFITCLYGGNVYTYTSSITDLSNIFNPN
jgi:hypothetical protein